MLDHLETLALLVNPGAQDCLVLLGQKGILVFLA